MMKAQCKLSPIMKTLINQFNAGAVATVDNDGKPAVSPKATFVIVDSKCIAYGDIRSPGTTGNIQQRPEVEVVFTDVLARRAVRISGVACIVEKSSKQGEELMPLFEQIWDPYIEHMSAFVKIDIVQAELILSPAYDLGIKKEELVKTNIDKLGKIAGN